MFEYCLSTATIMDIFAEEITERSGRVTDRYDDGSRLFTRSVLPHVDEVRPRDRVQGGVALKATGSEVCVHPYVFREVCRNGAIMAHSLESRRLVSRPEDDPDEAAWELRETIAACCADDVFADSVGHMRSAGDQEADVLLSILSWLSHLDPEIVSQIMDSFLGEGEQTRFALMNAVTSVARDRSDPEERWRLEELGGGIAARILPRPSGDSSAADVGYRDAVAVG
jgi:hypothetical protein